MRLEIQHFSKIKQASIKLDGITVIAGEIIRERVR